MKIKLKTSCFPTISPMKKSKPIKKNTKTQAAIYIMYQRRKRVSERRKDSGGRAETVAEETRARAGKGRRSGGREQGEVNGNERQRPSEKGKVGGGMGGEMKLFPSSSFPKDDNFRGCDREGLLGRVWSLEPWWEDEDNGQIFFACTLAHVVAQSGEWAKSLTPLQLIKTSLCLSTNQLITYYFYFKNKYYLTNLEINTIC